MNYTVETTEVADAEIETAFLHLAARDPEFTGRWLEGLLREIAGLAVFPNSHALAPERHILHRDVRRLLYRNGHTVYRILFFLTDTDGDVELDTGRILHVRHGSQQPMGEADLEDDSRP
jgi:plasmid stabilization system protein ParE